MPECPLGCGCCLPVPFKSSRPQPLFVEHGLLRIPGWQRLRGTLYQMRHLRADEGAGSVRPDPRPVPSGLHHERSGWWCCRAASWPSRAARQSCTPGRDCTPTWWICSRQARMGRSEKDGGFYAEKNGITTVKHNGTNTHLSDSIRPDKWGFLYVGKNERCTAENETNFYSARCFAR